MPLDVSTATPIYLRLLLLKYMQTYLRIMIFKLTMKRIYLVLTLALSGCTAIPPSTGHTATRSPIPNYPSPTCTSVDDCDFKWTKAIDSIQELTRMRLRVVTNQYLETFPGMKIPGLVGTVTKVPLGNGKYQLKATLTCVSGPGTCSDMPERGVQIFNMQIGGPDLVELPRETVNVSRP